MGVQQRARDVVLLLQRDRKAQVVAGVLLLAAFFLFFSDNEPRRQHIVQQQETGVGAVATDELYGDLKTAVISRLEDQDKALRTITTELKDQKNRLNENEIRTAEIFSTLIDKINKQQQSIPATQVGLHGGIEDLPAIPDGGAGLESFGEVANEGLVVPPPPAPIQQKVAYVGKADFVRVKLLAGVNAPTDGTPYPVMFKLIGDVKGPDSASLPLGEAHLMAAAQGSLTDSRVLYRLTNISMRYPNGERRDIGVDGWIVGEDGIRGMQGIPIDPLGKVLGAAAVAGVVEGIGAGLQAGSVTSNSTFFGSENTVDSGDLADYAIGRGISQPAKIWTDMIKQRTQELVPAIQVFSGREATAVFSQEFTVPGLYEMLEEGEYDVFATLD